MAMAQDVRLWAGLGLRVGEFRQEICLEKYFVLAGKLGISITIYPRFTLKGSQIICLKQLPELQS
jgi:hypothetical protein